MYGVLLDIADDSESSDRAIVTDEKGLAIPSHTIILIAVSELATQDKALAIGGFVSGPASNFKRLSKLNTEVSNLLVRTVGQKAGGLQGGRPVVKVLYSVDARSLLKPCTSLRSSMSRRNEVL